MQYAHRGLPNTCNPSAYGSVENNYHKISLKNCCRVGNKKFSPNGNNL